MPEISKDVISLLQYLAPGFVLAWVYYGLTSQIKQSQFERIVQASHIYCCNTGSRIYRKSFFFMDW